MIYKIITMSEFKTYSNTVYWTYRIDDIFWDQLEKNFNKKQFRLSSFKPNAVRKGDIILIFKNHKSPPKTGFIAIAQVETDMAHNSKNLKIFTDKNMNKFFCELSAIFMFDTTMNLSYIKKQIENFDSTSFRRSNIGENTMFIKISENVANDIIPVITECMPDFAKDESENDSESEDEFEIEEPEENLYECDDYDNSDDVEVKLGHFPIFFEPCGKCKWSDDMNVRIKNFKHHFQNCEECGKTDNNEVSVMSKFSEAQFHFTDLKNETQVEKLLEYYHNSKRWRLEFMDDEKKYDHIIINRINVPIKQNGEQNLYNGCYFILW